MAYRFTKARKKALLKARRKWMRMSPTARQKAMPAKTVPKKIYPIGQYMMIDVGKPGRHYVFVQKTRYGWRKVKAPRKLLKAGWKKVNKGLVYSPY